MPKPTALILLFAFLLLPFQPALAAGSRLTRATTASGAAAYGYGASSERLQKVLPDGTSRTYLGELSEVDQTGAFTDYLFAGKLRIASRDQTGLYYHTSDHLSSANLITDVSGAVVQKLDYLPFGSERLNERFASFASRFTYTDQERDDESGLLYYGARYYHPAIGRFTQPDPVVVENINRPEFKEALENPQLLNAYSYAGNNPVKYKDPEGEYLIAAGYRASRDIKRNKEHIINAVKQYKDVTPEMVAGVIYQERVGAGNVNPLDMTDVPLGLLGWDTSIGLGQVKKSTAQKMIEEGYMPSLDTYNWSVASFDFSRVITDEQKITLLLNDEEYNARCAAAYLQYHIDKWREEYPEITNDIGVLATLYNKKEGEPHSNPKASPEFGVKVRDNFEYVKSLLE